MARERNKPNMKLYDRNKPNMKLCSRRRSYSPPGGCFPSATSRFSSDNNNNNNNNNINNDNDNSLDRDRDLTEGNLDNLSVSLESKVSFSDDEVEEARVLVTDGVVKRDDDDVSFCGGGRVLEERERAGERRRVESGSGIKGAPPPAMSASDEALVSDGRDDENVGTSRMVVLRSDAAVSPSGSDRLGNEDEGTSSGVVVVQESLSSNGSFGGGFRNWQKDTDIFLL